MLIQHLFTDGSAHPQTKIGFGAYLLVNETDLTSTPPRQPVQLRRFEQTSSTKLELQTLLWALANLPESTGKIIVYTDCQNILRLPARRKKLEESDYRSKSKQPFNHAELYQAFFKALDSTSFQIIKVKGHQTSRAKNQIEQLFSLVDKASRRALRGTYQ